MTGSRSRRVLRLTPDRREWRSDRLVAEEPLEIRVGGRSVAVTMRTPGDDFDLAVGFLLTEGIVADAAEVLGIRACAGKETAAQTGLHNILDVTLAPTAPGFDPDRARAFYTTSSCGLCGKASIDAIRTRTRHPVADDPVRLDATVLAQLPDRARAGQRLFARTGGLHAAALFDAAGELLCVREDVGRHNAFDKVIGRAATDGRVPLRGTVILASGRAGFELTQKALMAGIPCLAAVSAPSSLAVELATEAGMTLIGFLRGGTMNVYAGHHRVA
jgi:FdhD protein